MANPTNPTTKREKFLKALSQGHSVTGAARVARIDRSTAYEWRKEDKEFSALWDDAKEAGGDLLEDEAWRRAAKGTLKPVYQGGKKVGTIREYSDTLLIFLLKGAKPQKYRERFDVNLGDKTDAELLAIATQGGLGGAGTPGDSPSAGANGSSSNSNSESGNEPGEDKQ